MSAEIVVVPLPLEWVHKDLKDKGFELDEVDVSANQRKFISESGKTREKQRVAKETREGQEKAVLLKFEEHVQVSCSWGALPFVLSALLSPSRR